MRSNRKRLAGADDVEDSFQHWGYLFVVRLDVVEKLLDTHIFFERFIVMEGQLRDSFEMVQAPAQRAASVAGGRFQALNALLPLFLISKDCDADARVAQIRRYLDVSARN